MIEAGTTGSDAIDIIIGRHRNGIKLLVKVWPEVEAFFQKWSAGLVERPTAGRLWTPLHPDQPISLWALNIANLAPNAARPYSLLHTGSGLSVDHYPNISFLRLQGASQPEGRGIIVEAVMGRSEIPPLAQRISDACNMFYAEYLQDITMRAVVTVYRLPNAA